MNILIIHAHKTFTFIISHNTFLRTNKSEHFPAHAPTVSTNDAGNTDFWAARACSYLTGKST